MYSRKFLILCFRRYIQNPESTPRPMPIGFCPRHKQKTERPKDQETRMMRYVSNTSPHAYGERMGEGQLFTLHFFRRHESNTPSQLWGILHVCPLTG